MNSNEYCYNTNDEDRPILLLSYERIFTKEFRAGLDEGWMSLHSKDEQYKKIKNKNDGFYMVNFNLIHKKAFAPHKQDC